MSAIQMAPNASGTGTLSIASPNTNSNRTLTLPDQTGTLVSTSGVNAVGQIPFSTDGATYTPTAKIVSGTAVASTSGTSIDFTSIPSWVKRITVMFNGVSLSGSANCLIQLGTGGTPTTSGYTGAFGVMTTAPAYTVTALSTGFIVQEQAASSAVNAYLTIANITANTWVGTGGFSDTAGARSGFVTGSVALSGVLNLVRVTTSNGTDTFDAGSINLLWE